MSHMHFCERQMQNCFAFDESVWWNLKRVFDEIVLHTMYGGHLWHFQFRKWSWDVIFAPFEIIAWMSYNEQNLFTNRQIVHVKFRNAFAKRHQLWPCFCVFGYLQICIWRINFVVFQMCFAPNAIFAFWEQNLGNRFWTLKLTSTNLIMSSSDARTLLKFGMPFCACISEFESATSGLGRARPTWDMPNAPAQVLAGTHAAAYRARTTCLCPMHTQTTQSVLLCRFTDRKSLVKPITPWHQRP